MSRVTPVLLNDTLNLIQLARETARQQGQQAQAERLDPLVKDLRNVVAEAQEERPSASPSGILAQGDFQKLLAAVQSRPTNPAGAPAPETPTARNQIVTAMTAGGMSELDIARQMGMTRDEVQMIVSLNRHSRPEVQA